jgi:hypothetical protein
MPAKKFAAHFEMNNDPDITLLLFVHSIQKFINKAYVILSMQWPMMLVVVVN